MKIKTCQRRKRCQRFDLVAVFLEHKSAVTLQLLYVCLHHSTKTIASSPHTKTPPSHNRETYMGLHTLCTLQRSNVKRLALEGVQFYKLVLYCGPSDHGPHWREKEGFWAQLCLLWWDTDTGRRKMPTHWSAYTGTLFYVCICTQK